MGKISKMVEMLKAGAKTKEEVLQATGMSEATFRIQVKYRLKKKGIIVEKNSKGKYSIAKTV